MLELPEVITLSKQVNKALRGKTITQVFNACINPKQKVSALSDKKKESLFNSLKD